MKVLIINQHRSDALGGSELQCDLIAKGLTDKNHEVLYGATNHDNKKISSSYPYNIISLDLSKKINLQKLLLDENPDIVLWSYNKFYLKKSIRIIKKYDIPIIFIINHMNDIRIIPNSIGLKNYLKNPKKIYYYIRKAIISLVNHSSFKEITGIITVNSQYENKLKVKNQITIFNPVPTELDEFNWENEYCVWVANIKEPKRPELYIELTRKINRINSNVDFLMIGNIQSERYKEDISKAEKEIDNFHYLGGLSPEKVNSVLNKAICLIHTCLPEGFGMNFIQAWNQECPTISYEFDPDNLIKSNNLGFISNNMNQMVEDVSLLISDKNKRSEMANNAKKLAIDSFDPKDTINKVEHFLTQVLQENEYPKP